MIRIYGVQNAAGQWWAFDGPQTTQPRFIPTWDPRCVTSIESYARQVAADTCGCLRVFTETGATDED